MLKRKIHLLIIDPDPSIARDVRKLLRHDKLFTFDTEHVRTIEQALLRLEKPGIDIILLGITFWNSDENNILAQAETITSYSKIVQKAPQIALVVMSDIDAEMQDYAMMKVGVQDYFVKKNITQQALRRIICRSIERHQIRYKLQKANQLLEKKSKEIQDFYHVISHELKTPLTSICAFTSILLDNKQTGNLNKEQREYLEIIKNNSARITLYLNDLLDASRLESGKIQLRLDEYNVKKFIQEAINAVMPKAME